MWRVVGSSVLREARSFWRVQEEAVGVEGEVIVEHRRRWAPEQKAALRAEVEAEGGRVNMVSRRHGISTSLLCNWRSACKAVLVVRAMAARPAGFAY